MHLNLKIMKMKKLTTTEIEEINRETILSMKGEYSFASYVPMAMFVKKLQIFKRSYQADY